MREHLGIAVMAGPLHSPLFLEQHGSVDIVVLSDVIEHPALPLGLLAESLAVLRPGGLLLLLTPNGEAGETAGVAVHRDGFRVDLEHLQYFSPEAIVRLAVRLNCRLEHLETLGFLSDADTYAEPAAVVGAPTKAGPAWLRRALRPAARFVRTLRVAFAPPGPDARAGAYNLFAILRKNCLTGAGAPGPQRRFPRH